MLSAYYKLCGYVELAFKLVGVALFTIMISVVFYEVMMRYIFNAPTFWAEPLARSAMIWMVFLGLAIGIRQKDNICVDFIADRFHGGFRVIAALVRLALVIIFAGILVIYGAQMATLGLKKNTIGLNIPLGYIQAVAPIAGFGMLLFSIELLIKRDWDRF
ncbi:TRAP transporter small permease [Mameliella sediminis]|uniref:TRAP transporter small permease n=1 Tax=Mameliella sediminis TaxID=2836866 RepID=UPI001C474C78|nr:TRAP transporter small permease [Mameliella sediminis]